MTDPSPLGAGVPAPEPPAPPAPPQPPTPENPDGVKPPIEDPLPPGAPGRVQVRPRPPPPIVAA